jgi:hypothetical protein
VPGIRRCNLTTQSLLEECAHSNLLTIPASRHIHKNIAKRNPSLPAQASTSIQWDRRANAANQYASGVILTGVNDGSYELVNHRVPSRCPSKRRFPVEMFVSLTGQCPSQQYWLRANKVHSFPQPPVPHSPRLNQKVVLVCHEYKLSTNNLLLALHKPFR